MRVLWIRKTHRFLGLVIGLQLLLWTASGLYFSWNDIGKVRGEHLFAGAGALAPDDSTYLSPNIVVKILMNQSAGIEKIDNISLRPLLGDPVYEIKYQQGGETRTAKPIDPMAVSKTPARYTDKAKVDKWFRRNCKGVIGRECTAQEKVDFISYMLTQ